MAEQRKRRVADQVHGRLVARDVEQEHLVDELLFAEPVALVFGREQSRQQVVGRMVALPSQHVLHMGEHVVGGGERGLDLLGAEDRVERLRERVRPAAHLVPVAVGHAEHLRDDRERQGEREVADDVGYISRRHLLQRVVDERLDPRPKLVDHLRREGLRHQPAQAGVVGWVDVEDRVRAAFLRLGRRLLGEHLHARRRRRIVDLHAERRVTQDAHDVVVPEQDPHLERASVHGIVLAERPVLPVRVVEEPGLEGVEDHGVARGGPGHVRKLPAVGRAGSGARPRGVLPPPVTLD